MTQGISKRRSVFKQLQQRARASGLTLTRRDEVGLPPFVLEGEFWDNRGIENPIYSKLHEENLRDALKDIKFNENEKQKVEGRILAEKIVREANVGGKKYDRTL